MKISHILAGYDTDKNKCVQKAHCYGLVYDHLFSRFDKHAPLDIAEIGVEKGWSIIAWKKFFPNAHVTGIDIVDEAEVKKPEIEYIISDVKEVKPEKEFDIVIDDGSHKISDVIYTVNDFKLKPGGVMVIEDVQKPDVWVDQIVQHTKAYAIETINLRRVSKQYDDFLIVLRNYGYYK